MKATIERYQAGQLVLLKNSEIIYISEVDQKNRIKNKDSDRWIYYYKGHYHNKSNNFKDNIVVIESDDGIFDIDVSKQNKITIADLKKFDAYYIGLLDSNSIKNIGKASYELNNNF